LWKLAPDYKGRLLSQASETFFLVSTRNFGTYLTLSPLHHFSGPFPLGAHTITAQHNFQLIHRRDPSSSGLQASSFKLQHLHDIAPPPPLRFTPISAAHTCCYPHTSSHHIVSLIFESLLRLLKISGSIPGFFSLQLDMVIC
jgi:hypothetical protein